MSYSELKVFKENGDVAPLKSFKNSHYITAIWVTLNDRYEIGTMFPLMEPVWKLQNSREIAEDDWYALMFTFDRVVVPPELIDRVALALERFKINPKSINHGPAMAEAMREAKKSMPNIRGIALYSTSTVEDPWGYVSDYIDECPACKGPISVDPDGEPVCRNNDCDVDVIEPDRNVYNLFKNENHWFLKTREETLREKGL